MKDATHTAAVVSPARRRWLYAGVALAAAGGGAVMAWRHLPAVAISARRGC